MPCVQDLIDFYNRLVIYQLFIMSSLLLYYKIFALINNNLMKQIDQQQENVKVKQNKQKNKSRRRDLFQTAPISCNFFQSNIPDLDYTNEIVKEVPKQDSIPIVSKEREEAVKQQPQQVKINTNIKINMNGQESSGFIFEASSSSDDQNQQIAVNSNTQIIFEEENHEDSLQEQRKKKKKNMVDVFGEKIQVNIEFNQDQSIQDSRTKINIINKNLSTSQNLQQKKQKQFLKAYSCMPFNTFAKLKLIRNKNSLGGQTFMLYLQSNLRYIMSAKNTTGQTFIFSESYDSYIENGEHYLGKVKSSFFGNELNLYTKGLSPQKAKSKNQIPRQIVCTAVTHSQQIMQDVKPRDFTVYLLKPEFSYYKDLVGVKLYEEQVPLDKLFNDYQANRDKIFLFQNRKSKWNQKQKMHSLNMKGRAKLPSVKNFILQNPAENGREIMLFGKMDDNQFSFDIHYPMSPFIGMAIALTSFTHKSW